MYISVVQLVYAVDANKHEVNYELNHCYDHKQMHTLVTCQLYRTQKEMQQPKKESLPFKYLLVIQIC